MYNGKFIFNDMISSVADKNDHIESSEDNVRFVVYGSW